MLRAVLVYILFGLVALTFPLRAPPSGSIRVEDVVRTDCSGRDVSCIDTCDFLCSDPGARCVAGVCTTREDVPNVECDRSTGGMVVVTEKRGVRTWSCVCTDPTYFGGPACDRRTPDVCAGGVFEYRPNNKSTCYCMPPLIRILIHRKPHCVPLGLGLYNLRLTMKYY